MRKYKMDQARANKIKLEILQVPTDEAYSTINMMWKVTTYHCYMANIQKKCTLQFGIDPGTVNLGIARLYRSALCLYEIEIAKREANSIQRIINANILLSYALSSLTGIQANYVIEGASYGDRFRQVELAEMRATIAYWIINALDIHNVEDVLLNPNQIQIVPPKKIRKAVFQDGNTKASDIWTNIPKNAADALACALYPMFSDS